MMWDPVRYLESCPSSDGACAVVFTDEEGGERGREGRRPPAWVLGTAVRSRAVAVPRPRPGAAAGARSTAPPTCTPRPASPTRASRSTAPSSTCRSAGTSRCGSRRTTSPTSARAGRWSSRGETALDGSFPVNMSGGVLSSNPIGASGLLRFAEAAMQVRGTAGEHQVDGREGRRRPGLRRRRAVLRHVGRRQQPRSVRRLASRPPERRNRRRDGNRDGSQRIEELPDARPGHPLAARSTGPTHKPDHPALVWEPTDGEGRTWTYAELLDATQGVAAGLRDRGHRARRQGADPRRQLPRDAARLVGLRDGRRGRGHHQHRARCRPRSLGSSTTPQCVAAITQPAVRRRSREAAPSSSGSR